MHIPKLIILADRGQMKAFETELTPNQTASLQLIQRSEFEVPRERFSDRFTDEAGGFPNGGPGGNGNSIGERMSLRDEDQTRIFRQIASEITHLLEKHPNKPWGFAAPSEINGAILDGLDARFKGTLKVNLSSDLVNTAETELAHHFERALT